MSETVQRMDYQTTYLSKELKSKLKYCIICTNKLSDIKFGALCKLSGGVPTFNDNCKNFKFDNLEYENLREEITNDYTEEEPLSTKFNEEVVYDHLELKDKTVNLYEIAKDKTFKTNTISKMYLLIIAVTILFVLVLINKEINNPQEYIWGGFFFLTSISYILFFHLKTINKIVVSKDYVELKNFKKTRILWSELLSVHPRISKEKVKGVDIYKFGVAFDLIIGDTYEYDDLPFLNHSNMVEFIKAIEYRRKYFFDNSPLYYAENGGGFN